MANRITGRVEILVNGEMLLNKAGATARGLGLSGKGNYELEAIVGDSGLHGYVERPVMAECEVTITDRSDQLLNDLAEIRENGTIIFRSAGGGKIYVMDGATCMRNFELVSGDGEVVIKYQGPFWVEDVQLI